MLSIALLGDFSVRCNETPLHGVDTPRMQSLLAYLMLHRDAPQSRMHIAFLFWPDTSEDQARTNLRNLLHYLRRALAEVGFFLDVSAQTLQWRPEGEFTLDVAEFEAALALADQARQKVNPAAHRQALEKAVELYRGDLLPSCYDDWIIPEREKLHQACLNVLEQLVSLSEEQREYPAAIHSAQRLLRLDPLHEATYCRLIRLHALNGDRAGALRIYHTCTTVLKRELDVEPSPATREAYEQLLGAEAKPAPPIPDVLETTAFSPLIGREREWAQLLQTWRQVLAGGGPRIVLLSGEAGIGKTRLEEELQQWAARQGIASASSRCYAAEGELAYAPVTTWLRHRPWSALEDVCLAELARLLPEVLVQRPDLPRPAALTEAWQRQHLFEALSRAVLGPNQPLLLTVDDLHWCDQDSLEWLHFLLRYDRTRRLLVVGAYRPEEIGENHPLLPTLQALRLEAQLTEIDLAPLDEMATQTLAAQISAAGLSSQAAHRLFCETEGNPLFVVETVRAGLLAAPPAAGPAAGDLSSDTLQDGAKLPPKVRQVLERRLAQVSPQTRELAGLAATIGREFSFRLLATASSCGEEALVQQIDELWRRRIVREHGADAYDFSHDKLRETAYLGLSAARRRLLHLRTAQALEALHTPQLDPVSHQLAAHYEQAGLPEQAAPYYLRAAEVARRVFANDEAVALLRRGLRLVEADGDRALSAQLLETLGDILELTAQHKQALRAFQEAQTFVPGTDSLSQARLHRKVSEVVREQRQYDQALDLCHRAELALGEKPAQTDSPWWDEWLEVQVGKIWAYYWLARWPEMSDLVSQLQPVVQRRAKPIARVRFLWASCMMSLRRERYRVSDEMLADAKEGLALSLEINSLKTKIEWRFELGFLHLWRGELDPAEEHLKIALELTETAGFLQMRTLTLTYLTVLYRFKGQMDLVQDFSGRAQGSAQTAHMPDYMAAARGNQAWLAWRHGDLAAAVQTGREALAIWHQSPLVYPFQWQALWPLIAAAQAQEREDEAWSYTQALLEPTQQLLPDELNTALEAAIQAKEKDHLEAARPHFDRAIQVAQQVGYL